MKHHVIYVPGLGDNIWHAQSIAVKFWRFHGVRGHFHAMPWAGEEKYEPKFQRLLAEIDQYRGQGHKVSLIGASAGASAVINAFIERPGKINGVVVICPKINGPETVSDKSYRENPAFKAALYKLQENLPKLAAEQRAKRMLMLYSSKDGTIPYAASTIPGVPEKRLPALRHGWAIMYAITLGVGGLLRFLKHLD